MDPALSSAAGSLSGVAYGHQNQQSAHHQEPDRFPRRYSTPYIRGRCRYAPQRIPDERLLNGYKIAAW